MQYLILILMVLGAGSVKAQIRAEFNLTVTPSLKLERIYWEEIRNRKGHTKKEKKVDTTIQLLQSKNIGLVSFNNTQQTIIIFKSEVGGLPSSLKHSAEIALPVILETKELDNKSKFSLKFSGNFVSSSEKNWNINFDADEIFQYTFDQIKISGFIKIQYMVPTNVRQLHILSSGFRKGLSNAKTNGFEGTLSDEIELEGHLDRITFVQPMSVIEQVIEIPERTFSSLAELESHLDIQIKRNLHIPGVLQ